MQLGGHKLVGDPLGDDLPLEGNTLGNLLMLVL